MNKKLTAKIQKLNPNLTKTAKYFSKTLVIDPDSKELLLKKGTIYVVFDASAPFEFDTELVTKVVTDVLHDSYFSSESISPIQSLEKAIVDLKDKINKISPESTKTKELLIEFNILAGVLWGNVMYIVQYGKGISYLVRTGEIKSLSTTSEGNFTAASGVVKDEDVLVFCTEGFSAKYAPQKLLTTAVGIEDLETAEACIILKFVVDTSITKDEVVTFAVTKNPKKLILEKVTEGTKSVWAKISSLISGKMKNKKPKREEIRDLGIRIKTRPAFNFRFISVAVIPLLILILAVSVAYSLIQKSKTPKTKEPVAVEQVKESTASSEPPQTLAATSIVPEDKTIIKKDFETFYDIKISDPDASPTSIVSLSNSLVVADSKSGKIFVSTLATPKFEAKTKQFISISSLVNVGGKVGFSDSEGYKIYDTISDKVAESYIQANMGITSSYLGFIYSLSGDKITKHVKNGTSLTASLWAQNADFSGAKSFDIAVSIFVLKQDGTLVSYTQGVKDSFVVSGIDKPFNNPVQIFTSIDLDNLYIADSGNRRVVLLDKSGKYVKQFVNQNADAWADIRSISVSPKGDTLYVLSGSKVFVVSL